MKILSLVFCLLMMVCAPVVEAATIGYIPMDDRPVNLEYVVDTGRVLGV